MASRDLVNNIGLVQLLAPEQAAASPLTGFTSSILDTMGFESAVIVVNVGTLTGFNASNYLSFTLQESNSTVGSSFTNVSVTANSLAGTASSAADFGDQERPFGTALSGAGGASGSAVTPSTTALLPAPGTIPNLYSGLLPLNATSMGSMHYRVGYIGNMRYIRLVGTFTGSPSVAYLDVLGIVSHAQNEPVTSPTPITAT